MVPSLQIESRPAGNKFNFPPVLSGRETFNDLLEFKVSEWVQNCVYMHTIILNMTISQNVLVFMLSVYENLF